MKWSWAWLILSIMSTCTGLILVMIFSHLLVVPYRSIHQFIHTQCEILQVTLETKQEGDTGSIDQQEQCVHVKVRYKHLGGGHRVGPLYLDTHTYDKRHHLGKCICTGCGIDIIPGNLTANMAVIETQVLAPGNLTDCYYRPDGSQDGLQWRLSTENKSIVNAMLWPSLLFIGGFVGLFFSCLAVQEDYNQKRNKRKPEHQPNLRPSHWCCGSAVQRTQQVNLENI